MFKRLSKKDLDGIMVSFRTKTKSKINQFKLNEEERRKRVLARKMLYLRVKSGSIKKQKCEVCGHFQATSAFGPNDLYNDPGFSELQF